MSKSKFAKGKGGFGGEAFIGHPLSMRQSVAWRNLPDPARRVLAVLEQEHAEQGAKMNGHLKTTYDQFIKAGMSRNRKAIALAIRQCEELGFVEVTFRPAPAAGPNKRPSTYRLTYPVNSRGQDLPSHEWRKIHDQEAADAALDRANGRKSTKHVLRAKLGRERREAREAQNLSA